MKKVNSNLFDELKRTSANLAVGWLLTRKDGKQMGFTSSDLGFTINGVYYSPTNAFSGSAAVSKNDLSVNNMSAIALVSDEITDADLRGGVYDNAKIEVFWVRPDRPEWGTIAIQGGTMGELQVRNGQYETELRSATQKLQQPYGRVYTIECDTEYGGPRCGVQLIATTWAPGMLVAGRLEGDATVGTIVKPTVYNGYWYECLTSAQSVSTDDDISGWGNDLQEVLQRFLDMRLGSGNSGNGDSLGLGGIVDDDPLELSYGHTGTTEPDWPVGVGTVVADGDVTWRAMLAREMPGTVHGVFNRGQFQCKDLAWVDDRYFQYGLLTWTSGQNKGFSIEVRSHRKHTTASFELLEAMPFQIVSGDTFTVRQGCPKTRDACKDRNNIYNMQAFPDMPTEEKALATPNYSSQGEKKEKSGKK